VPLLGYNNWGVVYAFLTWYLIGLIF
jgi:hypothetical protein